MKKKLVIALAVFGTLLVVKSIRTNLAQERSESLGVQVQGLSSDRVLRNVRYTKADDDARSLDVYQCESAVDRAKAKSETKHPVMVWVHGGAWRIGDKKNVVEKPTFFNAQGYVFVSVNYRMIDEVKPATMAFDVASSIAFLKKHADRFGIDPSQIHVAGHSAGAHLVALISSDPTYLNKFNLKLADIKSCIPIDTGCYDIPEHLREKSGLKLRTFTSVFTTNEQSQADVSPALRASDPKSMPPFLILHCQSRADAAKQSKAFAKKINRAGGNVTVKGFAGKSHRTINRELGEQGDAPTEAIQAFLDQLKPQPSKAQKMKSKQRDSTGPSERAATKLN